MKPYQKKFIEFALEYSALCFGEYTLKSGRISPYFFNAGLFKDAAALATLGELYANVIQENFYQQFDVLFGPAYKGISLATTAAIALKNKFNCNPGLSFNRKEVKDHGEGKLMIGDSLQNKRVLIIDDVITAGITIAESIQLIQKEGGTCQGVVIMLDRLEKGKQTSKSAIQEIAEQYHTQIISILSLNDLITYLKENHSSNVHAHLQNILHYQSMHGSL